MKTKLIAVTKPVDNMDEEQLLAYIARVSNPKNQDNHETSSKLLKYLVKNKHWSPFEMINVVIEIECSRAIGRQILRHRSFSFQEYSQRYAEVDDTMFVDYLEARTQDQTNRQNSIITDDNFINDQWEIIQDLAKENSKKLYRKAIELGIAKEQARAVLPEGLTQTKMYLNGNLRTWIHYCQLRMANGTQKEHQDIAKECWLIITEQFPSLKNIIGE